MQGGRAELAAAMRIAPLRADQETNEGTWQTGTLDLVCWSYRRLFLSAAAAKAQLERDETSETSEQVQHSVVHQAMTTAIFGRCGAAHPSSPPELLFCAPSRRPETKTTTTRPTLLPVGLLVAAAADADADADADAVGRVRWLRPTACEYSTVSPYGSHPTNTADRRHQALQHWLPSRLQIHHGRSVTMAYRVSLAPPSPYRKPETLQVRCRRASPLGLSYSSVSNTPACSHIHCSGT